MKTARRHELKENDLAHYLEQTVEWANTNAKLIVLAIVGVCAVIAAWFYFQQRSKQQAAAAWDQEYAAEASNDTQRLEQFVAANKNTAAGQLANLRLADIAFDEGVSQMSVDREQANKRLNDAKNRYYDVSQAAEDPRIEQRALLGLARHFETIGDFTTAKEHYTKLTKFENGLFKQEAQRKLADLARPQSVDFSTWYTKLAPKPQPSGTNPLVQSKLDQVPGFPAPAGDVGGPTTDASASSTGSATATPTGTSSATPTGTSSATPTGTSSATPTGTTSATPAGTSSATPSGSAKATATGTGK